MRTGLKDTLVTWGLLFRKW